MEGKIKKYKLLSDKLDEKNVGMSSFELNVNKRIMEGWVPLGGPTRTAICRGRLTVQEHTITQAMVQCS